MKKNIYSILIATLTVFFSGHTLADNKTDLFNEYKIGSSLEKNTHDLKNTDEQNINIKSHIQDNTGNSYDNYGLVITKKNNNQFFIKGISGFKYFNTIEQCLDSLPVYAKNIEKKYGEPDRKTKYIYIFPDKKNIKRKINVFCMESDINSVSLSVLDLDKSI